MACHRCRKALDLAATQPLFRRDASKSLLTGSPLVVPARFRPFHLGTRTYAASDSTSKTVRSVPTASSSSSSSHSSGGSSSSSSSVRGRKEDVDVDEEASGNGILNKLKEKLQATARRTTHSYMVYGATQRIYKACAAQADYKISAEDRKAGRVELLPDGEEVGVGGGLWHDDLKLPPTFSTWAHVTMLHMYLVVVRLRCLDRETHQTWQAQLVDHFFHDAEARMDTTHDLGSRALRQMYLKDLFVQWRGLLLACDEALARGDDAVLASALWRNLFKGREDVDLRHLAAVVGWVRRALRDLERMADEDVLICAEEAFVPPPTAELVGVDRPVQALSNVR